MDITSAIAGTKATIGIVGRILRIVQSAFRIKTEIQLTNEELNAKSDIRSFLEEAFPLNNMKVNAALALQAFLANEAPWEVAQATLAMVGPKFDSLIDRLIKISNAMIAAGRFTDANDLVERLQHQRTLYGQLANLPPPTDPQKEQLPLLANELEKLRRAVIKVEGTIAGSAKTAKAAKGGDRGIPSKS
jgi:hypothetical protein